MDAKLSLRSSARARMIIALWTLLFIPLAQAQIQIEAVALPDGRVRLSWPGESGQQQLEFAPGVERPWSTSALTVQVIGGQNVVDLQPTDAARFFRLRGLAGALPLTLASTSPAQGEGGVAVTRETIFRLSGPLSTDATLDANHLFAFAGGRKLLSRAELSEDHRTATLFYLENLPADARVEVTFDGTALFDANNLPVDLDRDGVLGGAAKLTFETLSTTALATTGVEGHVFASEKNADGSDRPLRNVTITVDGMEETLRTTTDTNGFFRLVPSPAGRFFVSVDGRTAEGSQWPGGAYYPFVGKAWDAMPGRTNNLAGGSGVIFLPLIQADALKAVSATADTKITFASSVLATNPALAGVEINVPANALFSDNGTRGGMVGMAPVPPDRLPEPLPPGLSLPLVITIQTDGARNFDTPVPVKFPNLPDPVTGIKLGPGEKTALWSFNHDTGRWEIQGSMTISADGLFAVSDPGVGVRQPGWHGPGPGGSGCGTDCDGDPPCRTCRKDPPPDKPDCSVWDTTCPDNPCRAEAKAVITSSTDFASDMGLAAAGGTGGDAGDCALGVATSAARAARDCSMNIATCAQINFGNAIIDGAIGSALGCVPKAGAVLGAAWSLKSIVINLKTLQDCYLGKPSPSLLSLPKAKGALESVGGSTSTALDRLIALLEQQIAVSTAASNLSAQIWGSGVWAGAETPQDVSVYQNFFSAVQSAVATNSPASQQVTTEERASLLTVPRPNHASIADVDQLLARLAEMANGQFRAGTPAADAFIAAFAELDVLTAVVAGEGWTTLFDGAVRALSELTGLIEPAAGSSAYPALTRPVAAAAKMAPSTPTPAVDMAFPATAHFFVLVDLRSGFVRHGQLGNDGRFPPLILPPNTPFIVSYFNPNSGHTGSAYFISGTSGRTTRIPAAPMGPDVTTDRDGDELTDFQELIRGTNAQRRDTDGDGVPDGAEIASGTNPNDGQPLGLGVMATRETPGTAVKMDTVNDCAVVADSSSGLALFNMANPLAPVLVNQVLPATGLLFDAVATAGDFVAAIPGTSAQTTAGVYLFTRSADGVLTAAGNVALGAVPETVVAAGRYAYAPGRSANAPSLAVVRLNGAQVLRHVPVSGGLPITTLALDGDVLWGASTRRLFSYRIAGDSLQELGGLDVGTLAVPAGESGPELVVGNGRAYVGDARGFRIIDVANPASPVLLHANTNTALPMRALALSGTGLLLGGQTLNVEVYDVRSDQATNFVTSFALPKLPRDLNLHRGYALAAVSEAGFGVVNFLAPDRGTTPPTINLRAFPSHPPGGQEATEQFFVSTTTSDDVQVRDVEFYIDGASVARSGKYPFAATLRAPQKTDDQSSFVIRAKATDTGGNSTWSEEITLTLLPDLTPPRLLSITPVHNSVPPRGSISSLTATFDSVMRLSNLSTGWALTEAGADGKLGTADDAPVSGGEVAYDTEQLTVLLRYTAPLRSGKYRSQVAASAADLAGNPLGTNVTWDFSIPTPKPVEALPSNQSVWVTDTLRRVEVRFDERLSASSVTSASLRVLSTNLVNPTVLSGGSTSLSANGRGAVLEFTQPIANGAWRIVLTPEIRDVFGSSVQTNLTADFIVKALTLWSTNASGTWESGRNWLGGLAPIFNDHAVIDRPDTNVSVTLNSNPTLTTLRATEEILLNGRRLYVTDTAELLGPLRWNAASTLAGGLIDLRGDALVTGGGTGSPSTGNTFGPNAASLERGTLRNSGHIDVTSGVWLLENNTATIENLASGVIRLTPTTPAFIERDRIAGTRGSDGTSSRLINQGLIEGLPDGRAWRLQTLDFENNGLVRLPNSQLEMESGIFRNTSSGSLEVYGLMLRYVSGALLGNVRLQNGLAYTNNSSSDTLALGGENQDFGTNGIVMYGGTLHVAAPLTIKRLNIQSPWSRLRLGDTLTVSDFASMKIERAEGSGELKLLGTTQYRPPAVGGGVASWNLYDTVHVRNFGTLQITNARVSCYDESLFVNETGGVIDALDGAGIVSGNFINAGQRTSPVGTNYGRIVVQGARDSQFQLANEGRVEIRSGETTFYYSPQRGQFEVAAGATLGIDGGILETNGLVTGEGQVLLNDITVRGRLDIRRAILDRQTPLFDGDHVLRELELKNFSGSVQFRAQGRVEVTEQLITSTNVSTGISEGTLRLHGAQVMGGAGVRNGATLENAGQLTMLGL